MKATLTSMHLRNFGGVLDSTFDFYPQCIVKGANGTGKTTLFNAFTFCLYGKDSQGRSDFGYKIRGRDGYIMHNREYSVELTFNIDGATRYFERVVLEKWAKPRGSEEAVLTGHESVFYVDKVRCATKKEYDLAVADIATDSVLRILTDTQFFISQKDEFKKATLLKLAFGTNSQEEADAITTESVLKKHSEFAPLIDDLKGTPIHEYRNKVEASIRAIKEELNDIPKKIAAKLETLPQEEDWEAIAALIEEKEKELKEINNQLADETLRQESSEREKNRLRAELSKLELQLNKIDNSIRMRISDSELIVRQQIAELDAEYSMATREYNRYAEQRKSNDAKLGELEEKLNILREQYQAIKLGTYQFSEDELECPTCHRPYKPCDVTQQKLDENVRIGKAIRFGDYQRLQEDNGFLDEKMKECRRRIDKAYTAKQDLNFTPTDIDMVIQKDNDHMEALRKIKDIKSEIANIPTTPNDQQLSEAYICIQTEIASLQQKLGLRDVINRIMEQVERLEDKQKKLNVNLAELEKALDAVKNIQKAKDIELADKINGMFEVVTWKFISEQLNGVERIVCDCWVNGKPYQECNHALQVNAGLDIINAISKSQGIYLPIFIDNAESVTNYIETQSQLILLSVDKNHKRLTIQQM